MAIAFDAALWLIALILVIPFSVLTLECLAALLPARQKRRLSNDRPSCAVLIPAHNEETVLARTLTVLAPQLLPGDRLCVVADNCSDRTAEIARTHGATVFERHDMERRGKGYALDFGMNALAVDPPAVVVIVDGDCVMSAGSLDVLVREAATLGRPVQAVYTLDELPNGDGKAHLSAFAFRFKNLLRPRGLDRLGIPCLLTGTGMAFPWTVLRDKATLASGHIVEDMQLGLDLAVAGYPPAFCQQAVVTSELPSGDNASLVQRKRWEHGHLQTLLTQCPRLLAAGVAKRQPKLIGLALELSVPPLSMLLLLWFCALILLVGAIGFGASTLPAIVLGGAGMMTLIAILAIGFARSQLPLATILAAPIYIIWKLPIYASFVTNRQKAWIRTQRSSIP